ncbi:hypothetical protein D3C87_2121530 [compost metagenome]
MIKGLILTIAFLGMTACAHKAHDSKGCGHGDKKECAGNCKTDEKKTECKDCHGEKP